MIIPLSSMSGIDTVAATSLYSFDLKLFGLFFLVFYIIPYPMYRCVAHYLKWELNVKSLARHWQDLFDGLNYDLILFIFGNYTFTMHWITIAAFFPSLFIYGQIAELPATKTSLPNINQWPKGMWVVFLIALRGYLHSIILAFAGYHIYLACQFSLPFVIIYVSCLSIPATILFSAFLLAKEVNTNWLRTKFYFVFRKKQAIDNESGNHHTSTPIADEATSLLPTTHVSTLPNPYTYKITIHLHHWQIFYVLAFFTRFQHPVSQIGAGIVLACYMEGICAYGYDKLVNEEAI
ncbi:hypothetical protein BDF20DRAFT_839351 [Mycotypha africana]|uniref:uncharacterized protein n=1 Tax=Mycotypha africana TaxID=64632 RepID=UPI002301DD0E|nr:uncharacterized protein BDF20DRAFT_839351 [Mycotypha africana]KAI8968228.1 hypothetical protein BDF20DRAFT_839351 [Mycotypha africana]